MDVALKKLGYDNNTNWINLEPCISPGFLYLPCMYQFEGDLHMVPLVSLFEEKHLVHQGWAKVWAHSL